MVARSRIVVEFNNKDFENQLGSYKDINIYYGIKENYALVYCNRNDEANVLKLLNVGDNRAYISNEYVEKIKF